MVRTLSACFVLFALAGSAPDAAAQTPRKAPEFAVRLTPSGQSLLSQHRGKVVLLAFMSTTCGHCQKLAPVLSDLQKEYGPRGFQALGVAFNDMANMLVPDFNKQVRPNYPMGWSPRDPVLEFIQHSPMKQLFVPILVFIDRDGMIRSQHLGDDPFFQNQNQNLRQTIETMLKSAAPARKKAS